MTHTAYVYLADGRKVIAEITGEDQGTALVDGRVITVWRFVSPYEALGYGELVHGPQRNGGTFDAIWRPEEYECGFAIASDGQGNLAFYLRDKVTGQWRELTEEEEAKERHAMKADERDMAQIEREWRAYRNEGLGSGG